METIHLFGSYEAAQIFNDAIKTELKGLVGVTRRCRTRYKAYKVIHNVAHPKVVNHLDDILAKQIGVDYARR